MASTIPRLTLAEAMARQSRRLALENQQPAIPTLKQAVQEVEKAAIIAALSACHHVRAQTAKALGISRVTLFHKMRRYGLLPGGKAELGPSPDSTGESSHG